MRSCEEHNTPGPATDTDPDCVAVGGAESGRGVGGEGGAVRGRRCVDRVCVWVGEWVGGCVGGWVMSGWAGCVRVRSTTPAAPQAQTQTMSPLGVQSPGEGLGVKTEQSEVVGV